MAKELQVRTKVWTNVIICAALALFFGIALYLRIALPYNQVFVGDWVKFTEADAWFHMRLVDNLVHNFPHRISFDPYGLYPGGMSLGGFPPGFTYFLTLVIWLVGLGSPTQHTIDVVGAYFPTVLAAITIIPVFFVGKELFNRWVGVMAAGLVALSPGQFLGRSILGFTDHHAAEVLFTTIAVLFFILAIKSARQKQATSSQWRTMGRPIVYSFLAGLFLGIYLLTWVGGLLFVFIFFVYFIAQFVIDHLKGKSSDYLCVISSITFLVALVMFLLSSPEKIAIVSLLIALVVPFVLWGLSRVIAGKGIRTIYYLLAVGAFGLISLIILHFADPSLFKAIMSNLKLFTWDLGTTVEEVQPFLFANRTFSLLNVWANFTTGFFISLISIGILSYLVIKRGEADKSLLVVWSLVSLALTLAQSRFAYYLTINVALLTSYLSWQALEFSGFKELAIKPLKAQKAKTKKTAKKAFRITTRHINMTLALTAVFFLAFFPNIGRAVGTAKQPHFVPDDAWIDSLTWLKANTPEPFGNPDFYYQLYTTPFSYPDSAYGIAASWDYGYWITRIARRIPNCNGFAGPASPVVARFFTALEEAQANEILDSLGSRYVIVDYKLVTGKFWALVTWAGRELEEFREVYYMPRAGGKLRPQPIFYPEYYRCLAVRLYNFNGDEFIPKWSTAVISYEEKTTPEGKPYKEITSLESFPDYDKAQAYVKAQKSDKYRIVGTSPFVSPVPLEKLRHYRLVHSSEASVPTGEGKTSPKVKIFEYIR